MNRFGHKEIPHLTPMRGVAALGVFSFHLIAFFLPALKLALTNLGLMAGISHFYFAVDFFFLLSGYLLYTLYHSRFETMQPSSILDFWKKRFARIYPLLLITSTIMLAITFHWYGKWDWWKWFSDITLLNSIPRYFQPLNSPSWSISAEWFAYLLAPFLFFALGRTPGKFRALFLAGGYLLLTFLICFKWGTIDSRTLLRGTCGFTMGTALAASGFHFRNRRVATQVFLICGLLFFAILFWLPQSPAADLAAYAMLLGVLVTTPDVNGRTEKLLKSRPIEWLGLVSYSLYLWHPTVFGVFLTAEKAGWISEKRGAAGDAIWFFVLAGITLALSTVSYYLIEMECRRVVEKWLTKLGIKNWPPKKSAGAALDPAVVR